MKNVLVDTAGVVEVGGVPTSLIVCKQCLSSLRHGQMPALSIANRLFVDDVPEELKDLTVIEESMISLCRACVIIV